ncbi:hypothetical protein [Streptomyces sp. NBC_01358]|uniref:hypothetical protein n=1 Tax=Streptomyces sp. NBC_01358 TaxID=2903837 RepID=UPI003FCD9A36
MAANNLYDGETYDARLEPVGWNRPASTTPRGRRRSGSTGTCAPCFPASRLPPAGSRRWSPSRSPPARQARRSWTSAVTGSAAPPTPSPLWWCTAT